MIYDMRTYDLVPGKLQQYMDAVREVGKPVRESYGIKLAGWYYADVGRLNRVVHIWAYRDWEHLEQGKTGFRKDPRWTGEYLPRVRGAILRQQTQVMVSPDFAPEPA